METVSLVRQETAARQEQILAFIKQCVQTKGYPPSIREICDVVGLMSSSTVHANLQFLEQRGLIRGDKTIPRAIAMVEE